MTQNEYEDIMRDGFPEDEPNLCRECGEELNAIEDKLCADCVTKAASYYGLAEEYLKAQPQRNGAYIVDRLYPSVCAGHQRL